MGCLHAYRIRRHWLMRLAFSNAAFTHEGVKMPEVPVILNDDMSIVETPQRWLFNIALERGRNATAGHQGVACPVVASIGAGVWPSTARQHRGNRRPVDMP